MKSTKKKKKTPKTFKEAIGQAQTQLSRSVAQNGIDFLEELEDLLPRLDESM